MLRLTGTQKLQVVLSGAATASRVTVSYMDVIATAVPTGATQLSVTNGATPVDICDAPAASTTRQIDHIKLVALAAMTATFSVNDGSARDWDTIVLSTGDVYEWRPGGAEIRDTNGQVKRVMPGYLPLTGGTVSGATTFSAALTYGGVTLTNAVTGTGKMVLDTSPTIATPVINSAAHVGGTWVADATWTLPAVTLGGAVTVPTGVAITGAGTAALTGFASASLGLITGTTITSSSGVVVRGTVTPGSGTGFELIGGVTPYIQVYNRDTPGYLPLNIYNSTFQVNPSSSGVFHITAIGSVGIGTTAPQTRLALSSGSAISFEASAGVTDIALTHSADTLTLTGGNLTLGTNSFTAGAGSFTTGAFSSSTDSIFGTGVTGRGPTVNVGQNAAGVSIPLQLANYQATANGNAAALDFEFNRLNGTPAVFSEIRSEVVDNTTAARVGKVVISAAVAGTVTDILTVSGASGGGAAVTGTLSATQFLEITEMTAPSAGAANTARIFAVDSGAGKTILKVQFASGAAQTLATEP